MKKKMVSVLLAAILLSQSVFVAAFAPEVWDLRERGGEGVAPSAAAGPTPSAYSGDLLLYGVSHDRMDWMSAPIDNPKESRVVGATQVNASAPNKNYFAATYFPAAEKVLWYRATSKYASDTTGNSNASVGALEDLYTVSAASTSGFIYDVAYDAAGETIYFLRNANKNPANTAHEVRLYYSTSFAFGEGTASSTIKMTPSTNNNNGGRFQDGETGEALSATGFFYALEVTPDGTAYGLFRSHADGAASLWHIETDNAVTATSFTVNCTKIGDIPGYVTDDVPQSMAYNPDTGTLFWTQYTEAGGGHLIELDPADGEVLRVAETAGNITGIFFARELDDFTVTLRVDGEGALVCGAETTDAVTVGAGRVSRRLDAGDIPTPVPAPGYRFIGWQTDDGVWWLAAGDIPIGKNQTILACFAPDGTAEDAAFTDAVSAPGSNLGLNRIGTYPWTAVAAAGRVTAKSTNSAWDGEPIVTTPFPYAIESSLEYNEPHVHNLYPGYTAPKYDTTSTMTAIARLEAGATISFDYIVKGMSTRDYLYFRLNGAELLKRGGDSTDSEEWTHYEYVVPETGDYLLEWSFSKTGTLSYQGDAAFVSNIFAGDPPPPLTGLTLPPEVDVAVGNYVELPLRQTPEDAVLGQVQWTSSDPFVATVSELGRVKGVAPGETTITAVYNGVSAATAVTVTDDARPVRLYAYQSPNEQTALVGNWVAFGAENFSEVEVIAEDALVSAAAYVYRADSEDNYIYGYYTQGNAFFRTTPEHLGREREVLGAASHSVLDMAYDDTSDTMYAIVYWEGIFPVNALCKVDLTDGSLELVATLNTLSRIYTLTITGEGRAYGVTESPNSNAAYLYGIDLRRGTVTELGQTGAMLAREQSVAYDKETGRVFWTQYYKGHFDEIGNAGLYEVNLDSGRATLLEQSAGLARYTALMAVHGLSVEGYYSDRAGAALQCDITLADDLPGSAALALLPTEGYARLCDGTHERVALTWTWADAAPEMEGRTTHAVIGTVSGGTFAHGGTVEGTVTFAPRPETPVITAQPADVTVTRDATATLRVTASVSDGGTLTYQWFVSDSPGAGSAEVAGATAAEYAPPTHTVGRKYYSVIVTNTLGGLTASAAGEAACVTVSEPAAPPATSGGTGSTGGTGSAGSADSVVTYPDTPLWAEAAVAFAAARGIIAPADRFEPERAVTRGEFLIALMRAYDIPPAEAGAAPAFADVDAESELHPYAAAARALGITNGTDAAGVCFSPDAILSRQEVAAFIVKVLAALDRTPDADTGRRLAQYVDGETVALWAVPYVETAIRLGLMASTSATEWVVAPEMTVDRSQMVQLIYNLFDHGTNSEL